MKVLVTGASGFIGQELAIALLGDSSFSEIVLTDLVKPHIPYATSGHGIALRSVSADLTNAEARQALLGSTTFDCIYLLHGIMSGAAEANLDLGLKVNLESQIAILNILRTTYPGTTKVVYASVGAVYGPAQKGEVVSENTVPVPQSSYGAQKLMIETLINDFSRRGLIDGRVCRLPTVTIRAGAPTGAASSFASAIFREPLSGKRTVLPVSRDQEMCICSPRTVIKNLITASKIPKEKFGLFRTVVLPGIKVSVQQMLDALEEVGGRAALELIDERLDEVTNRIVASWPADYDTSRAASLGFEPDISLLENVQEYFQRYINGN
jgi:nucleoside-diphosphate-sugar epimerase